MTPHPELVRPIAADRFIEVARRIGDMGDGKDTGGLLSLATDLIGDDPGEAVAIILRIKALTKLMGHPLMRVWSVGSGLSEQEAYLSEPLLRAAADEPMIGKDNDLRFDADSFFAHVLELSDDGGHG